MDIFRIIRVLVSVIVFNIKLTFDPNIDLHSVFEDDEWLATKDK
jgi:hypothetical protein